MFDLGLIHITRLIVHEIPRRYLRAEGAGNGPVLSELESLSDAFIRQAALPSARSISYRSPRRAIVRSIGRS